MCIAITRYDVVSAVRIIALLGQMIELEDKINPGFISRLPYALIVLEIALIVGQYVRIGQQNCILCRRWIYVYVSSIHTVQSKIYIEQITRARLIEWRKW